MANRPAKTQKMQLRPPVELVEALQQLFPSCGMTTANELAVELIEQGVRYIQSAETSPPIPPDLRRLRALVRGEPFEETPPPSVPSPDELRMIVRELMRQELGLVLKEAKQADQIEPKTEQQSARRTAPAKRRPSDSKPASSEEE